MALHSKYDPQQDRMRLILRPAQGPLRAFWITRRQWLGLLHALSGAAPAAAAPPGKAPPLAPPKPAVSPDSLAVAAVPLQGMRLRRMAGGVRLLLVADGDTVSLDLPAAAIVEVQSMLRQQAERAGWDTEAALARLGAASVASAALKRARLY